MNYYQRHIGDWMTATAHLTEVEECIYSRCLDQYYTRELPLPLDVDRVCRLVRASSKEAKKAVATVLEEFFVCGNEGWSQKRCDAELTKYKEKSEKAKASVSARWSKESTERNTNVDTNVSKTYDARNANQEPITNNQEPIKEANASSSIGAYPAEFEKVWQAYPRKAGGSKKDSHKAWSARLRAGATAEGIADGVARYAAYCKAEGTDERFIKQAVTFFGVGDHYLADWTPSAPRAPPLTASRVEKQQAWIAELTGQGEKNGTSGTSSSSSVIDVEASVVS
jgi:uncharacterized protein YdaU (DUF1376 family)